MQFVVYSNKLLIVKRYIVIVGRIFLLMIVFYAFFAVIGSMSYLLSDFYKDCNNIEIGTTELEFRQKMNVYIDDPEYSFSEALSYAKGFGKENALSIGVQKWYAMDYWRCVALVDDGLVVDMHLDFE